MVWRLMDNVIIIIEIVNQMQEEALILAGKADLGYSWKSLGCGDKTFIILMLPPDIQANR